MKFPAFFEQIPSLVVMDRLAAALGAAEGGVLEYVYADAVRLTGHSCPTVAGAWLMGCKGLLALFPNETPLRGGVQVELRANRADGTAGVVGSVLTLLTGAAGSEGFKGLGGQHIRRDQMHFGVEMGAQVRIRRIDNNACVLLDYHPEVVPPPAAMAPLMARVIGGNATPIEQVEFACLWQDRVRRILIESADDPGLLSVQLC